MESVDSPREVHLNQAHRLNDVSIILGNQQIVAAVLILDGRAGKLAQRVGTDNHTAGMDANLSVGILQLLGEGKRTADNGSPFSNASFSSGTYLKQFFRFTFGTFPSWDRPDCRQTCRAHIRTERIDILERNLLHTAHILDARFGCHGTIG